MKILDFFLRGGIPVIGVWKWAAYLIVALGTAAVIENGTNDGLTQASEIVCIVGGCLAAASAGWSFLREN